MFSPPKKSKANRKGWLEDSLSHRSGPWHPTACSIPLQPILQSSCVVSTALSSSPSRQEAPLFVTQGSFILQPFLIILLARLQLDANSFAKRAVEEAVFPSLHRGCLKGNL